MVIAWGGFGTDGLGAPGEPLKAANAFLQGDGVLAAVPVAGTPRYMLDDALGSIRGVTDSTGVLTATADYNVFGAIRASTGTQSIFAFTGEQRDPETGFTFLRARYLDPVLGRFTQAPRVGTCTPTSPTTRRPGSIPVGSQLQAGLRLARRLTRGRLLR
jgi:RHS repeat-associated protein